MCKKSKTIAIILCLFLGIFGVHKFYLNKIKMGILYFILAFCAISIILAIIDLIILIFISNEEFDKLYNSDYIDDELVTENAYLSSTDIEEEMEEDIDEKISTLDSKCKNCGANISKEAIRTGVCEYCGSILS